MLIRFCCNRNTKRHFHPSSSKMTQRCYLFIWVHIPDVRLLQIISVSFKHHSFHDDNWCSMEIKLTDQPLQVNWKGSLMSVLSECVQRATQINLQCFLWSRCWGISCWCTWWPSPCPCPSAGEGASLGRHRSVTKDAATTFTEWWTTLFFFILSSVTFQVTWGQPSELLQAWLSSSSH